MRQMEEAIAAVGHAPAPLLAADSLENIPD
jgi:hypothetical protein